MTSDRDIERLLDAWLADGPLRVADRVVDDAAARIAQQTQRPAWRLRPWRFPSMSTPVRLIALTAALLTALIAGSVLLSGGGPAPVPTPTPSPAATASQPAIVSPPSPTPSPRQLPDGPLVAGQYVAHAVAGDHMAFTVTAPEGWTGLGGWFIAGPHQSAGPTGIGVAFLHGPRTVDDPCLSATAPSGAATPSGAPGTAAVDDLVAQLSAFQGAQVTSVTDTTLAGYSGKEVDLDLPATLSCGQYYVFAEPQGLYAQGPSNRWRIFLLDVDGTTAVVTLSDFAATPVADRTAAEGILDSLRITP